MTAAKQYLTVVKPSSAAEKATQTTLDTIVVTPAIAKGWKLPPFQRELKDSKKVQEVADAIKTEQVIPGIITLGVLRSAPSTHYLVDGQHRRHAFLMAELAEAFVDIRWIHCDTMGELADEFRKLNGSIAKMTGDDTLRAIAETNKSLQFIKGKFPRVGYSHIRRDANAAIISMSALLRCWQGSAPEAPTTGGGSVTMIADNLSLEEAEQCVAFCELAWKAWGADRQHHKLWGNLNMVLCMWMYRRLVITAYSANVKKITREMFMKCLMSLAANEEYCSWLVGRNLNDRDRSPTYQRIKYMFGQRLEQETGDKHRLPSPAWSGR